MTNAEKFSVVPSRAAAVFHRLPAPVREVLRLCDGTRTVEAIAATSEIPVVRIAPVLERLASLGVIATRQTNQRRRRSLTPQGVSWVQGVEAQAAVVAPAAVAQVAVAQVVAAHVEAEPLPPAPIAPAIDFSDDEEKFFASSLDHLIED